MNLEKLQTRLSNVVQQQQDQEDNRITFSLIRCSQFTGGS